MRTIEEAVGSLPREIQPARDLWPEVERKSRRRDRVRNARRIGGAAVGLLVLAAIPAGLLVRGGDNAARRLASARAEYGSARQALLRALDDRRTGVDAAVAQLVRRDLETVDRDLAETDRISAGGDGTELVGALTEQYQRGARLLSETAGALTGPATFWRERS